MATIYRLTAIPVAEGPQDKDTECTEFTLTNMGVKTATGSLGDPVLVLIGRGSSRSKARRNSPTR